MKTNIFTAILILIINTSCTTLKFCESDLKWNNSFKQSYSELLVKNDSILYGVHGGECYMIDSSTGKILSILPQEIVVPFLKKYGEEKYDDSKGNRYITYLKTLDYFCYSVTKIDYGRIFRWQTYDKTKLIISRKTDNKKITLKFKISNFSSVFQVLPYKSNMLIISYDTYEDGIKKIGMIDLDKLFEK